MRRCPLQYSCLCNTVSFVLVPYGTIEHLHRYAYFTVILSVYISIVFANTLLIVVICVERTLHEPMYVFLCSLFVNEIYGSTALMPQLMTQMFSETHEVSFVLCLLQMFCLYTAASVEYCNLAAMAYDRYVSICKPLHYSVIMNSRRVCGVVSLVWSYSFIRFSLTMSLTLPVAYCGNSVNQVFCDLKHVNSLACSDKYSRNIHNIAAGFLSILVPLVFIVFSYIRILTVCLKMSKQAQRKAISTCTPHIVSLLNLSIGCFFDIVLSRFSTDRVPAALRICLPLYLCFVQPLLNPVMYGVKTSKIRNTQRELLGSVGSLFPPCLLQAQQKTRI
uniref:Olfactory receptor n=1 Tax=Myripristis murdjan TaxID=586833 RepID=A0A667X824_9TELE